MKVSTTMPELLKSNGFSLRELSKRSGVPVSTLSEWSSNRSPKNPLQAKVSLQLSLIPLIQNLTPIDFEILVDLIFRNAGWKRVSVLGKTQKDIDIELSSPVTNETAVVQIKSESSYKTVEDYVDRFRSWTQASRLFFVTHTLTGKPSVQISDHRLLIWNIEEVSKLTVQAGLTDWILRKAG